MTCSPKGLITNSSVTLEEMAQLSICSEQISCPDVRQEIKNLIAHWRRFAGLHIEAKPATDGTLDLTAAATAILDELRVIERYLAVADRYAASRDLHRALYHVLLLATRVHQLAVIDNETSIVAWHQSIEGARRGGSLRSAGIRIRNRQMAQEYRKRQGGRTKDTDLMAAIGAPEGLKKRASVYAVKSGLRDLDRD